MSQVSLIDDAGVESPPTATTPHSGQGGSTISLFSTPSGTSPPNPRCGDISIPDHWHPEIESCLREECLTDSARNEMVRTLVNQLFARSSKPTRTQCEDLSRKLILKYPFLKDDMGNGYVSYHCSVLLLCKHSKCYEYRIGIRVLKTFWGQEVLIFFLLLR